MLSAEKAVSFTNMDYMVIESDNATSSDVFKKQAHVYSTQKGGFIKNGPITLEDNATTHMIGTKNFIMVDVNGTTNYSTMLNLTDNSTTQEQMIEF